MGNPFKTKEFKELQLKWYRKLKTKRVGFKDIEDANGNLLKQLDKRTNAYKTKEATEEFYYQLDSYLRENRLDINPIHYKMLSLYARGVKQIEIAKRLKRHKTTVYHVILRYRKLVVQNDNKPSDT